MTSIRFGCGEFIPGKRIIPPGGGGGGPPPPIIITDPIDPEPPPGIPPAPPDDFWVCICPNEQAPGFNHPQGNCDPANRRCVKESQADQLGATRRTVAYLTQAECQNRGYGEEPCSTSYWQCDERDRLPCPPPFERFYSQQRSCRHCGRFKAGTQPSSCRYVSRTNCLFECTSVNCPTAPPGDVPPVVREPGGPGTGLDPRRPGDANERPRGPITPGGARQTPLWVCEEVITLCPDERTTKTITTECFQKIPRAGQRAFDTKRQCELNCNSSPRTFPCPVDTTGVDGTTFAIPIPDPLPDLEERRGPGATTISERLPGGSRRRPDQTFQDIVGIGNSLGPSLDDLNNSITNSTILNNRMFTTLDVEDLYQSEFSDTSVSSNGEIYHPIYNIFNYENSRIKSTNFVANEKNRNIFADTVAPEVAYFLDFKNTNVEWTDKYALGLSKDVIIKSLRVDVYNTLNSILDIDGQPLNPNFFINMIKRRLIYGTIDELDMNYFTELLSKQKEKQKLELKRSSNDDLNHRAALGLIASRGFSIDVNKYSRLQDKIEISRFKYLLTDVEASVNVETLEGKTLSIPMNDAGLSVSSMDLEEEFVAPGPGDGYYFVIETLQGEEIPLLMDTAVSATYSMSPEVRKIALDMIGESPYMKFSASSTFDKSELGPNYKTDYTVSALYYKLEQTSVKDLPVNDNLVTLTEGTYVLLTDENEIHEHSMTYGGNATHVSLQYDDPFIQYAAESGKFTMSQRDITFRDFDPNRTQGSYSKIVRSIPQALIIKPSNSVEDNPFYAYSKLEVITESQVVRSMFGMPSIGRAEDEKLRRVLPNKLTATEENTYQLGLAGIKDTQNIYYPFDKNFYSDSYVVKNRSPVGEVFYNLLEKTLTENYNFAYLTWWDVYRRLNLTDFTKFVYSCPNDFYNTLEKGFKGYKIKPVLQRDSAIPSVLNLKPDKVESPVVLTESLRYKTQTPSN